MIEYVLHKPAQEERAAIDDAIARSLDVLLFFFQAEDGIRAGHVTGVQTCALPISFGATFGPPVQAFDHGQPIPRGPNKLNGITVLGGDAIAKFEDTRFWLSYGDA